MPKGWAGSAGWSRRSARACPPRWRGWPLAILAEPANPSCRPRSLPPPPRPAAGRAHLPPAAALPAAGRAHPHQPRVLRAERAPTVVVGASGHTFVVVGASGHTLLSLALTAINA